jgi:hypothetical protein
MKSIYTLLIFLFTVVSLSAQNYYCFDKKFRRIEDRSKMKYIAYVKSDSNARVMNISSQTLYAEGKINVADTLSFDGKVSFYDSEVKLKAIRYYKNGVSLPNIPIDFQLKKNLSKQNGVYAYYLTANDDGEFCAYKKNNIDPRWNEESIYATGKITDTTSLILDDFVTFYNEKGGIVSMKKYQQGKPAPFISTTLDYNQPYEIIDVVSHHLVCDSYYIDTEMEYFKVKCQLIGADGAIGIRTSISSVPSTEQTVGRTELIIQGTAIKLRKKE